MPYEKREWSLTTINDDIFRWSGFSSLEAHKFFSPIPVFEIFHHAYVLERGDEITIDWTILRLIDN